MRVAVGGRGVGVGDGAKVGVSVGLLVGVYVGVLVGVADGVGDGVAVAVGLLVAVGTTDGVEVGTSVGASATSVGVGSGVPQADSTAASSSKARIETAARFRRFMGVSSQARWTDCTPKQPVVNAGPVRSYGERIGLNGGAMHLRSSPSAMALIPKFGTC